MPRLKAIIHPYFGRLPVLTATCPGCGTPAGGTCYLMCEFSPAYYSPEQEREEALAFEHMTPGEVIRHNREEASYDGLGFDDDHDDTPDVNDDEFQCDRCRVIGDIEDSFKSGDEYLCAGCTTPTMPMPRVPVPANWDADDLPF